MKLFFEAKHGAIQRLEVDGSSAGKDDSSAAALTDARLYDMSSWADLVKDLGLSTARTEHISTWLEGILGSGKS